MGILSKTKKYTAKEGTPKKYATKLGIVSKQEYVDCTVETEWIPTGIKKTHFYPLLDGRTHEGYHIERIKYNDDGTVNFCTLKFNSTDELAEYINYTVKGTFIAYDRDRDEVIVSASDYMAIRINYFNFHKFKEMERERR
jgi:hypothetical protein